MFETGLTPNQIQSICDFVFYMTVILLVTGAWIAGCLYGYKCGRKDERSRSRNASLRVYKTPKILQGSALPNAKQPTNYTVNRRNHAYQTR